MALAAAPRCYLLTSLLAAGHQPPALRNFIWTPEDPDSFSKREQRPSLPAAVTAAGTGRTPGAVEAEPELPPSSC